MNKEASNLVLERDWEIGIQLYEEKCESKNNLDEERLKQYRFASKLRLQRLH
jgi:hypothetical protein